jgi:hypothetical protein
MRTNNRVKNIRKRLRNNVNMPLLPLLNNKENKMKPSNCYDCLDNNSCEVNQVNEVTELAEINVSTKNCFIFNCLPEDTINIILEYLPIDTRLKILKNKYNKKIIEVKLQNFCEADFKKIFESACTAHEILNIVLKKESVLSTKLSTYMLTTDWLKTMHADHQYLSFYKKQLTGIILAALKYYTKIYKMVNRNNISIYKTSGMLVYYYYNYYCNNNKIKKIEKMILKLYAQLILF